MLCSKTTLEIRSTTRKNISEEKIHQFFPLFSCSIFIHIFSKMVLISGKIRMICMAFAFIFGIFTFQTSDHSKLSSGDNYIGISIFFFVEHNRKTFLNNCIALNKFNFFQQSVQTFHREKKNIRPPSRTNS